MPFTKINPIAARRSPDRRSSPAASHYSTGRISGFGSDSSYDFIQSPALQFTLSNNGSDKSEGSSWVKSDFETETKSSTSTRASIPRPRQRSRLELLNSSQASTGGQLRLVPAEYVQQHQRHSMHQTTSDAVTLNVPPLDSATLITTSPPLEVEVWLSDTACFALNNPRTPSETNSFGYWTEGITQLDGINNQSNNNHAFYPNSDNPNWWSDYCLSFKDASGDQHSLLGIPQNLPRFSETQVRDLAKRTPTAAGYYRTTGSSCLDTGMTASIHVNPPATLRTNSTSSRSLDFTPRDTNGASRYLKRPIDDTRCEYTSPNHINSSTLLPERVIKKPKHRTLPLGILGTPDNVTNSEFNPQPRGVPSSITAELMDERHVRAWYQSVEAEGSSSPQTSSAELFPPYNQSQPGYHHQSSGGVLWGIEVRRPPDASDASFNYPFDESISTPILGNFNFNISPTIDRMDDNIGDHNENFNLNSPEHVSDISSVPVSPGLSESPGPHTYGPARPPGQHLTIQQPGFSHHNYPCFETHGFDQLQSGSGWAHQDQMVYDNWGGGPCIYDQPQPGESMQGDNHPPNPEDKDPKRKRGPFDDDRRGAVEKVRRLGACLRCHYLRESCDLGNPCSNCLKVVGKQKIWGSFPCTRFKITEAQLFRKGNSKFKQESAQLLKVNDQWKTNTELQSIYLGRPPPIASKFWPQGRAYPRLRIRCREFVPKSGDLLYETWTEDGVEIKYQIPPFAASDMEDTSDALRNYVRETFDLFKNDMVSEEHDPLVQLVFGEAIRYSDQHQCTNEGKIGTQEACMLKDALKIWIVTRLAYEGYGILEGGENFGVQMINNPKSPYHETVPISPILDNQLDTIGIQYMVKLKSNVLKALKTRIAQRRKSQWYEIFLTIFVLLHNLEYVARRQYQYMKRHENTWAAQKGTKTIEFFTTTWMTEWELAANMLIKHFQIALKGAVPFSFNWEESEEPKKKAKGKRKATKDPIEEAKSKAGMDDTAVEFMKSVCTHLRERESEFRNLKKESEERRYSKDMVWVSQLFLDE